MGVNASVSNGFASTSIEREEEQRDGEPDDRRPRHERIVGAVAEPAHHEDEVAAQDERPQEDRTLERGPQPGDGEQQRRRAGVVLGDVPQRVVVREQRPLHDHDREQRGGEHDEHHASALPEKVVVVATNPDDEHHDAGRRPDRAEHQREDAEIGLHEPSALLGPSSTFGGS